jgi:hypothetical protein
MAGTKRGPRKKTSNKGKDSSPREGDKQKQRRQNSGQKEVLSKGQQLSPAVTRNSKKTSTQVVVAATTTITPKHLDHTFQSFDPDKNQEPRNEARQHLNIEDSETEDSKEENTTAPKTLFASANDPNAHYDSPPTPIYKKYLHSTNYYKTIYTRDDDSTSDEDENRKTKPIKASRNDNDSSNTTTEPHAQNIDTFLPPSKYTEYTPIQKNPMPKNLRPSQRK